MASNKLSNLRIASTASEAIEVIGHKTIHAVSPKNIIRIKFHFRRSNNMNLNKSHNPSYSKYVAVDVVSTG